MNIRIQEKHLHLQDDGHSLQATMSYFRLCKQLFGGETTAREASPTGKQEQWLHWKQVGS